MSYRPANHSSPWPFLLPLLGALACGDEPGGTQPGRDGSQGAVMVSLLVPGPDVSNFYVGVYPELPNTLDTSNMLEVESGFDARAFNGAIYVWEGQSGRYTRYAVDDELRLAEDVALSFREVGGTGTVMTSFVAPDRAYSLTRDELQIIVWNPEAMEIVGTISGAALVDPEYPELDYGEPSVFGDYVAWPIQWSDSVNNRFKPEVGVVLVSTKSMDPAFVVRDARCGAGWMLFVDDADDLYATGNGAFGFAHFFGTDPQPYPADCVVRMKAGSLTFDPDYMRDLNKATGSPAIYHPWHVGGHALLAAVWDADDDPSAIDPDSYWSHPLLRKLVLIDEESSTELAGVPKSAVWSTLSHRIDDTLYMLSTEGSPFGGDGSSSQSQLYKVTTAGAELALTTRGFLWSIGRVR